MIVAERKPLEAIVEMLKNDRKVLAVGCGTCVAVCFAGGKKEVEMLASSLRMTTDLKGEKLEFLEDPTEVLEECFENIDNESQGRVFKAIESALHRYKKIPK